MAVNRVTITTPETGADAPAPAAAAVVDATGSRPAWLPEKFKTAEDLATAYKELETKQGTAPADKPAEPVAPPVTAPTIIKEQVAAAGFDLTAIAKEYLANGNKLTPETQKALTDKGIPQAAIDTYIQGANAAAAAIVTEITSIAGGADKLATVYQWARANLTADELEGYNSIMEAGNKNASKVAFAGVFARYQAATGKEPALVAAQTTPTASGVIPYASNEQIVEAMRDRRYKTDPAYRAAVSKRVAATDMNLGGRS